MEREPIAIEMDELGEAMARPPEDLAEWLLDRETGHLACFEEGDLSVLEDPGLIRAVENEADRFAPIPRIDSHEEYEWMAAFTTRLIGGGPRRRFDDALAGKGAFGRFRNVLRDYPELRAQWFAERREHLVVAATRWLEAEQIAYRAQRREIVPPRAPASAAKKRLPLRLWHVLLLGADGGEHVGHAVRGLDAGSRSPRELFKILARDLCESNGIEWRNRFIEGRNDYELAGTRVSHDQRAVRVAVDVPREILELFRPEVSIPDHDPEVELPHSRSRGRGSDRFVDGASRRT